jgi:hypothetical protein
MAKTKNLGIRATPERARELAHMATDRETSVQRLVDEAIERAYFSANVASTQKGSGQLSELITAELPERAIKISTAGRSAKKQKVVKTLIEILDDCPEKYSTFLDYVVRQLLKIHDEARAGKT